MEIPRGEHTIEITARVPDTAPLSLVFVAEQTLMPDRPFLVEPPAQPPASVSAISK